MNGKTTQLGYDVSGRLASLCGADQTCPSATPWRSFEYDGTSSRITLVKDVTGSVIRGYSYRAAGGVEKAWIAGATYDTGKERSEFLVAGSTVTVKRYIDGTSTADTAYTVQAVTGMYRVSQITGACPECGAENSTVTFNTSGFPAQKRDGNNVLTEKQFDASGNLTQVIEASGTSLSRTTVHEYAVPGTDPLPTVWGTGVKDFWKRKVEPSGVKPGASVITTRTWGGTNNLTLTETVSGYLAVSDTSPTSRTTVTVHDAQEGHRGDGRGRDHAVHVR